MSEPLTTWEDGASPSQFHAGQMLEFNRGHFRGKTLRVDGGHSFYNREDVYYEGDPSKGLVSKAGWQIVLDIEVDGEWLYAIREHEDEILKYIEVPV